LLSHRRAAIETIKVLLFSRYISVLQNHHPANSNLFPKHQIT
jgi:hypothetical protein